MRLLSVLKLLVVHWRQFLRYLVPFRYKYSQQNFVLKCPLYHSFRVQFRLSVHLFNDTFSISWVVGYIVDGRKIESAICKKHMSLQNTLQRQLKRRAHASKHTIYFTLSLFFPEISYCLRTWNHVVLSMTDSVVNEKEGRVWKKGFLSWFKVLPPHLPRGSERNHETRVPGYRSEYDYGSIVWNEQTTADCQQRVIHHLSKQSWQNQMSVLNLLTKY